MSDDMQDPTQPVTISASDFPALFLAVQSTSADDLLTSLGIDPSTISDNNNDLPVA